MKNLRKKTGCLVMAVLLLIMTFVPAMSVTVSAAANIEGRLITVGGKTVNSGMKIAEVEKLFGKPKLTTPSYWGGYAYTFYGDKSVSGDRCGWCDRLLWKCQPGI